MAIHILDNISQVSIYIIKGKPSGYGQYFWSNGSMYSGQFAKGFKHGFGRWRKSKNYRSNTYEGQYCRDKKEGFGIFRWYSGNVYIGYYKNDEREGIGQMIWTDGSIYLGEWKVGIQHGYGKMHFPNGNVKEGLFERNIFKGTNGLKSYNIPKELLDKKFDIMNNAKNFPFSVEMINWNKVASSTATAQSSYTTCSRNKNLLNKSVDAVTIRNERYILNSEKISDNDKAASQLIKKIERKNLKYRFRNTHANSSNGNYIMKGKPKKGTYSFCIY